MFTLEDEVDELDRDLGKYRRELDLLQRAPSEGRWCGSKTDFVDRVQTLTEKIRDLEKQRAEYFAEQFAAAEAYQDDAA